MATVPEGLFEGADDPQGLLADTLKLLPLGPYFVFLGIGYVELARMDVQVQQGWVVLE